MMYYQSVSFAFAHLITCILSQTPAGTSPATDSTLAVNYGSKEVTPGIVLAKSESSMIPTFNYQPSSPDQTYTLLMIDLTIPSSRVDPSKLDPAQLPLAPGFPANRTTRLHYWQAGLTFATNGSLVNTTEPVAYYQGPSPPPGDIPHDYVFYLFEQNEDFAPPPEDSPFNVDNINANPMNRMSFDVQRIASGEGFGDLVAANYIVVQISSGSANSTSGSSAGGGAAPTGATMPSPSASPFTGAAGSIELKGIVVFTSLAAVLVMFVGM